MANLQDLNRRIKSFTNTRKITKAMEMVSAAKLRRAQTRIETLRPFADALIVLTVRVTKGMQAPSQHPLLDERETKKVGIVMMTGDGGLAGAFNANVLRRSLQLRTEWEAKGAEVSWLVVGKKGASSLRFRGFELDAAWRDFTANPHFRDAERIGVTLVEKFAAAEYDKVVLVYNHFESAVTQHVIVQDLLPLTDELLVQAMSGFKVRDFQGNPNRTTRPALISGDGNMHLGDALKNGEQKPEGDHGDAKYSPDWHFEPDQAQLLDRLLPTYVEQTVFRALLESTASEHGSRMSAMRSATENAGDLIDALTLQRNRARQAAITQEILEVVAGADAL